MQLHEFGLPTGNRLGRNCGVTAVALLAGVPFNKAWDKLEVLHRQTRILRGRVRHPRNWPGTTNHRDRTLALVAFGCDVVEVPLRRRMTLATWVLRYSRPGVTYMVRTTSHVQTVMDGRIVDQTTERPEHPREYWGSGKYVTLVTEVTRPTALNTHDLTTIPDWLRRAKATA